ncbi:MAG: AAA family ATPase [Veillonellales bacterium]
MLTEISLKGFQSHTDTTITLDHGLNVVTGATDSGKTSIIRAIRWVAFGEPAGDSFVNKAVGFATVIIKTDKATITKTRKGAKTSYSIDYGNDHTMLYEKAEVPEEVEELLGMTKSTFGDFKAALNFAYQLDSPFLLSESPSAGAKVLGKLANAEIVDVAISQASKETHHLQQVKKSAENSQAEIMLQLQDYMNLEAVKENLDACDLLMAQVDKDRDRHDVLNGLTAVFGVTKSKLTSIALTLDKFSNLPGIEEDLQDIKKSQQHYDTLLSLYGRYTVLIKQVSDLEIALQNYSGISTATSRLKELQEFSAKLSRLKKLGQLYQETQCRANAAEEVIRITASVNGLDVILTTLGSTNDKQNNLVKLACDFAFASGRKKVLQQRLGKLHDLSIVSDELEGIRAKSGSLTRFIQLRGMLDVAGIKARSTAQAEKLATHNVHVANNDLAYVWSSLDVCPLCNQKLH